MTDDEQQELKAVRRTAKVFGWLALALGLALLVVALGELTCRGSASDRNNAAQESAPHH